MAYKEQLSVVERINVPGTNKADLMEIYSEWQNSDMPYDKLTESIAYKGPRITAEQLAEEVPENKRSNYRILDVGAGTGLVAEELTKLGFLSIDALDPSPDMLKKAKEKEVYKEFFQVFLTREPLPINDNSYNSVVTSGCFMENHIPLEAIPELLRIVKPGGIIVITTRYKYLDTVDAFRGKFQQFLDDLQKAGKWIQLQKTVFPKYDFKDDGIVWKYTVK